MRVKSYCMTDIRSGNVSGVPSIDVWLKFQIWAIFSDLCMGTSLPCLLWASDAQLPSDIIKRQFDVHTKRISSNLFHHTYLGKLEESVNKSRLVPRYPFYWSPVLCSLDAHGLWARRPRAGCRSDYNRTTSNDIYLAGVCFQGLPSLYGQDRHPDLIFPDLSSKRVYLLSAMWLCNIGHFHSCCPSPVLNILLEIPWKIQYLITHVCITLVILHVFKMSYELKNIEQCYRGLH